MGPAVAPPALVVGGIRDVLASVTWWWRWPSRPTEVPRPCKGAAVSPRALPRLGFPHHRQRSSFAAPPPARLCFATALPRPVLRPSCLKIRRRVAVAVAVAVVFGAGQCGVWSVPRADGVMGNRSTIVSPNPGADFGPPTPTPQMVHLAHPRCTLATLLRHCHVVPPTVVSRSNRTCANAIFACIYLVIAGVL